MKRRLLILTLCLTLIIAICSVPTIFADNGKDASISINAVSTPMDEIDLSHNNALKSVDMFLGESICLKTDILVSRYIVIEDTSTIKATYTVPDGINYSVTSKPYDTSDTYIRREKAVITPTKVGNYQIVVEYTLGNNKYFDGIDINVYSKDDINKVSLIPSVTTVRTNRPVNFSLSINGSTSLALKDECNITINGTKLDSLKGYEVGSDVTKLDIVITLLGKEYKETIDVVKANKLEVASINRETFGFMMDDKEGKILLDVTRGSYPNIAVITDSASLVDTKIVTSNNDALDRYELTIKFGTATSNENMLIRVDDKNIMCKLNIIDAIYSLAIQPESTKFESGKISTFHVVINGIKDVDTDVKWSVNGTEEATSRTPFAYKSISNNEIKLTAEVGGIIAEYNYKIDTSTNSVILTVVVSIVVILISVPILIALKKKPKTDLKAMILKDNKQTISALEKLKKHIQDGDNKSVLKYILKINGAITRDEKRAQQESFECENKAFGAALSSLSEAKALMSDLIATHKNCPKDVSINIVDNVIYSLENANKTIEKVREAMGESDK